MAGDELLLGAVVVGAVVGAVVVDVELEPTTAFVLEALPGTAVATAAPIAAVPSAAKSASIPVVRRIRMMASSLTRRAGSTGKCLLMAAPCRFDLPPVERGQLNRHRRAAEGTL
jgi:hypothetical protein